MKPQFDWFDLTFRAFAPATAQEIMEWLLRDDALLKEAVVWQYLLSQLRYADADDLARVLSRAAPAVAAAVLEKAYTYRQALAAIDLIDPAQAVAIVQKLGYDPRKSRLR